MDPCSRMSVRNTILSLFQASSRNRTMGARFLLRRDCISSIALSPLSLVVVPMVLVYCIFGFISPRRLRCAIKIPLPFFPAIAPWDTQEACCDHLSRLSCLNILHDSTGRCVSMCQSFSGPREHHSRSSLAI